MDEVATPDSSRIWTREDWQRGSPREHSKELFREALLDWVPDRELLLDSERMAERSAFAKTHRVPDRFFEELSQTYRAIAERVVGAAVGVPERPREAMLELLDDQFQLLR